MLQKPKAIEIKGFQLIKKIFKKVEKLFKKFLHSQNSCSILIKLA